MATKILQFGEGNFLRGFFDWMVQRLNDHTSFNGSIRIVQPRRPDWTPAALALNQQHGHYHVCLRGIEHGTPIESLEKITCVEGVSLPSELDSLALLPSVRFVVSNTTEAGIEYRPGVDTFPAKVARFLKTRYSAGLPGIVFLPCELIDHNGDALRDCILHYLRDDSSTPPSLLSWIQSECIFCSTLVDRIVSGAPNKEDSARYQSLLDAPDQAIVCAEPYHFFAIQPPSGFDLERELPLVQAGLNVVYTSDLHPYHTRKVRFLNGAHTSTIPEGILAGFTEVSELVQDPHFNAHLKTILWDEVFPTVDLPDTEKTAYAESILERFANPYAHHKLLSIALNSVSKWKVRVLPTILDYRARFGTLPPHLWASLDFLIRLYTTRPDLVQDTPDVVFFFQTQPSRSEILSNASLWGMDLTSLENTK